MKRFLTPTYRLPEVFKLNTFLKSLQHNVCITDTNVCDEVILLINSIKYNTSVEDRASINARLGELKYSSKVVVDEVEPKSLEIVEHTCMGTYTYYDEYDEYNTECCEQVFYTINKQLILDWDEVYIPYTKTTRFGTEDLIEQACRIIEHVEDLTNTTYYV